MPLQQRLMDEMKEAMKSGDQARLSVIRLLRSQIKNREIEKGKDRSLTEQELMEVVSTSIKQRRDAIELFRQGQRQDLVDKEQHEIEILQTFLPEPLGQDELVRLAQAAIQESGAQGVKDMGKTMKLLMPRVAGRAEGAAVSQVVKDLLSRS
jgi:uncharacterized protein YqeY